MRVVKHPYWCCCTGAVLCVCVCAHASVRTEAPVLDIVASKPAPPPVVSAYILVPGAQDAEVPVPIAKATIECV